jgi:nucleoside 2-deoxyribosyltransferase
MSDVYVAGSLRHSPKEWWVIYEKISEVAKKTGLKTYVPHIDGIKILKQDVDDLQDSGLDSLMRSKAYKLNFEKIKDSKILIAEITKPSTGTGIEIGFALQMNKPIICLAQKDVDITSMVLGPVHLGLIKLIRYENEKDCLEKLERTLKEM